MWLGWGLLSISLASYYGYIMFISDNKSELLIGEASHGHFQIELACTACHSEAFGGEEILQDACLDCHADELRESHDSHPKKKFTDPRNADRLEILDARYCITCHVEHQREQTRDMGVTLPDDYCFHCHYEIGNERESHKDLPFNSCANAGCHNYHDNRALYEDFLVENAGGQWLKEISDLLEANAAEKINLDNYPGYDKSHPLYTHRQIEDNFPIEFNNYKGTSHENAGMACQACHGESGTNQWIDNPGIEQCQKCHNSEAESFLQGKHGMRLVNGMMPMSPGQTSALSFKPEAAHLELNCNSCHGSHEFNVEFARKDACLNCHDDEHSLAFENSPHGLLLDDASEENNYQVNGVSCASCHMPRHETTVNGEKVIAVQHNQNNNLRPNEKMIRTVCMNCHNLEFSIDALADEKLIKNNFSGKPGKHVLSIDWATERVKTK